MWSFVGLIASDYLFIISEVRYEVPDFRKLLGNIVQGHSRHTFLWLYMRLTHREEVYLMDRDRTISYHSGSVCLLEITV